MSEDNKKLNKSKKIMKQVKELELSEEEMKQVVGGSLYSKDTTQLGKVLDKVLA